MTLRMYLEDIDGQKHLFSRELENDLVADELEELAVTFNMILASCGYDEYITINSNESED